MTEITEIIKVQTTDGRIIKIDSKKEETVGEFIQKISIKENIKESEIRLNINNTDLKKEDKINKYIRNGKLINLLYTGTGGL